MKLSTKHYVCIILGLVVVSVAGVVIFKSSSKPVDVENYQPISEFQSSYDALMGKKQAVAVEPEGTAKSDNADKPGNNMVAPSTSDAATTTSSTSGKKQQAKDYYDIEETIRIVNGLEIAQAQSENFYEFLEYMAKQDYRLVADDIIQAKTKLLAILQEMFVLEQQYEEMSGIWVVAKSIGAGAGSIARDGNSKELFSTAAAVYMTGGIGAAISLRNSETLKQAKNAVFEEFDKEMELKKSLSKKLETLRMAYIDYLTEFTPIYNKYMDEWDRLCLNKDKAYLDLYAGRMTDAYNSAEEILKKYPTNREALLLKSFSLINIGSGYMNEVNDNAQVAAISKEVNFIEMEKPNDQWNKFYVEADVALDNYLDSYPGHSAPALVLKGLLHLRLGEASRAMSYFDQAAMEYPRQAAQLTDLLDSYRVRTYLNQTAEGQYLLRLYRSTMEGYGAFSPNFLKAQYYAQIGDLKNSQTEIYNHFFRRGNQGIYDCLLSDMQYCENYLYGSFKQLLLERHYLDLYIKADEGRLSSKNELKLAIHNRSDVDLENVRVFLCIHYTDMYTDEYDVVKVPAVNLINHYERKDLGAVTLDYPGKTTKDITRVRAIVMTDDKICWVDEPKFKQSRRLDLSSKTSSTSLSLADLAKKNFADEYDLNAESLAATIRSGVHIVTPDGKGDGSFVGKVTDMFSRSNKNLQIELPRILSFIDPTFTINELMDEEKVILPIHNYLAGSVIRLEFEHKPKDNEVIPLYIYSSFANFKVDIVYQDGKYEVLNVAQL